MIRLSITGLMGSGKSFCSKIFEQKGIPVFYSDEISKSLLINDKNLKEEIIKEFGDVYDEFGKLIAYKLANIVFAEGCDFKLKKLNEIVHPYVIDEYERFGFENRNEDFTLVESAILFESNLRKHVNKVIFVNASLETRLKRVWQRSRITEEEYHQRMKYQINTETKIKLSNFVINNDDFDDVYSQVDNIIKLLTTVARQGT